MGGAGKSPGDEVGGVGAPVPLPWIQHCDILQHAWQEKHLQAMAPILISLHVFIIHFGLLLLPDGFRSPRNTRCLPPNFTQEILLGKLLLGVFEKKTYYTKFGSIHNVL